MEWIELICDLAPLDSVHIEWEHEQHSSPRQVESDCGANDLQCNAMQLQLIYLNLRCLVDVRRGRMIGHLSRFHIIVKVLIK